MTFAVILSAVALPIVPKVELNFEIILYITIFVFQSPGSCFKSAICYQDLISKHTDRHVFATVERKKNYSPKRFDDSVHLDIPFSGHLNIDVCFSLQF